ncbi:MAG TPA: FAD-binding oxidoreductase [Candidatus Limnocylindria bacterium]|jgi:FAD/FMN-containing dehydrogenase|nr:FAD-binding oxidoreductase [Candidatus Limnocylindria bacterium]
MSVTQNLDAASLGTLREKFRGELIVPGDAEYDSSRVVWNAIADRHPAIVARCTRVEDVIAAVRFAREQDLVIAVRGGGHSVAGFSTCDGGIVIDLSGMRTVHVDPTKRTARVQGGALLEQLDRAAQEYGLACPVGVVGHTGVAGLTLGGGMGRLQRKHGYTIDNLLSVDLVTPDGVLRHVSDEDDPELFWGLRGAGANFGIATAFEFRLHPIGPNVTTAVVVFPIERAREAAALYRDLSRSAPEHIHLGLNFANAPGGRAATGGPRGNATVAVGATHFGDQKDAERDLRALRDRLEPLVEAFTPTTYLAVQTMSDEEMAWGKRFYMKGAFLDELADAAVDRAAEQVSVAPGECSIGLWAQGGAIANVPEDAMAFTGRGAAYWLGAEAFWVEKERDGDHIAWGRAAMAALKPFTRAGQYVNDVVEEGDDVVRGIYGNAKYERLRKLKRTHDPENVFRLNQNIRP